MKTDSDLVKLVCEHAMLWKYEHGETQRVGETTFVGFAWRTPSGLFAAPSDWDPLTNEDDCAALLERIATDHDVWLFTYLRAAEIIWECRIRVKRGRLCRVRDVDRKRTVVLSALLANGVELA